MARAEATFVGIVHYFHGNTVIGSRGNVIYVSDDGGTRWESAVDIAPQLSSFFQLAGRFALTRRLCRAGIHHVLPAADGRLIVFAGSTIGAWQVPPGSFLPGISGIHGSRPLAVAMTPEGVAYYGEYRGNPERSPISIWRSADQGHGWEVCYQFADVRHVHGIYVDPFDNSVWVTTGDADSECGIWRTADGFRTIDRVVGGHQKFRAIQLLFDERHVYYGSDTPLEQNFIYRLCRTTGTVDRLQEVPGSVFYGCRSGRWLVFSTAWEPSRVNRLRAATVWGSEDGSDWNELGRYDKDLLPPRLFQYGQVKLPAGSGDGQHLWHTPFGTEGDQVSVKTRL